MFMKIKEIILNLAKNAVIVAESELGSGNGKIKKQMAIDYVVKNLPFSSIVKAIISALLSKFIDDAVEIAVEYLHSLPEEKGV